MGVIADLQSLVRNATSVHARLMSELRIASRATYTLILNNVEGEILRELGIHGSKLRMLSNIYSDEKIDSGIRMLENPEYKTVKNGAIFVGSFQHIPNILAVRNLINITNAIRTKYPDFRMHVVGSHDPPESLLQNLEQNEGIVFHGWLPDDAVRYRFFYDFYQIIYLKLCLNLCIEEFFVMFCSLKRFMNRWNAPWCPSPQGQASKARLRQPTCMGYP